MANEALRRITVQEYFAILEASPMKLDFIDGQVIDPSKMVSPTGEAGGSLWHGVIALNLGGILGPAAAASGCVAASSDVKVKVNDLDDYCFPDLTVVCGDFVEEDRMIENPVLVVEILSPSTQGYDKGPKFEGYLRLSSIKEILFVFQDRPTVERYRRYDSVYVYERAEGLDAEIDVLGASMRLSEVYRGVKFPSKAPLPQSSDSP